MKPVKKRVSKKVAPKKKVVKKSKSVDVFAKAKSYVGLKQVEAVPMNRGFYSKYRGWELPKGEESKDPGYVIRYPDGYVSWSPKAQFDAAYQTNKNFDFSAALFLLKQGHKVARKGWNGKKMWIVLVPGSKNIKVMKNTPYAKAGCTNGLNINGHIDMMTANGDMQPGWLASQSDMLASDWCTVD